MKFGLVLLLALSASAQAEKLKCTATEGRQHGPLKVKSVLNLDLSYDSLGLVLSNIQGQVLVAEEWAELDSDDDAYLGVFNIKKLQENPEYRPIKYKNSAQFKNFDSSSIQHVLSYGMYGNFIISRKPGISGKYQAHYIFQSGDHMGGTIHYTCSAK
jgi:hypothetical protein